MSWHRDSVGILLQRLVFSTLVMASILIYDNCEDHHEHLEECLVKTSIPLLTSIVIIFLKVSEL